MKKLIHYMSQSNVKTVIENNVRAFPLDKLDDVTNGLLNLNVSIHECLQFPDDSNDNRIIKYKVVNNKIDVYANYSVYLNKMYKTIDEYKFDSKTRRWNFPETKLDELREKAKQLNYSLELEENELPKPKEKTIKATMKKDVNKNLVYVMCPYKEDVVEFLKTITNRKFDGLTKLWNFPLNEMNFIQNKLVELDVSVELLKSSENFKLTKSSYYKSLKQ